MHRAAASTLVLLLVLGSACSYPSYRGARGDAPPPAARTATVEELTLPRPTDPELTNQPHIKLVRLPGDAYQRGYLYGRTFAADWRRATDEMERHAIKYVREYVPPKFLARFGVRQYTAMVAQQFSGSGSEKTMPPEYRAYVQGIADGAGFDSGRLLRTIAIVMLSDASCSAFVAFGPATDDGRLLQMRNLDWGETDLPASEGSIVLLHEPPGGQRWLSIGFVGLVGSLSGINESGIAISEIGAGTNDKTKKGMPMPLLMEDVLRRARTLDEAVAIIRKAPGSGGYNYMIGSARERRGVAIEKTANHTAVFEIGPENYKDNPYFEGFAGFDCRADTAADPTVRSVQDCSGGPGSPVGRGSYERRYRKQLELFEAWGRRLDIDRAKELALAVAPRNNLHSILYDYDRGRLYFYNQAWFADGRKDASREDQMRTRAAAQPPAVIDLRRYFRYPEVQAATPAPIPDRSMVPPPPPPPPVDPPRPAGDPVGLPPPAIR